MATTELELVAAEVAADLHRRTGADEHGEVAVACAAVGTAGMVVALLARGHDAVEGVPGAVAGASGEEMAVSVCRATVVGMEKASCAAEAVALAVEAPAAVRSEAAAPAVE